jgi:hypothetical protein
VEYRPLNEQADIWVRHLQDVGLARTSSNYRHQPRLKAAWPVLVPLIDDSNPDDPLAVTIHSPRVDLVPLYLRAAVVATLQSPGENDKW